MGMQEEYASKDGKHSVGLRNMRLNEMENLVQERGSITLKELSDIFEISLNTVRNDVGNILQRGKICKVYGGVMSLNSENTLLEYGVREGRSSDSKRRICSKAAECIEDGDIIFIDSGTTTVHMVEFLKNKRDIKVLTNNIMIITALLGMDNIEVIGIGGKVRNKTKSFASIEGINVLEAYNIKKAFMAATALSIENGVMNSSYGERSIKSYVVESAAYTYLLADSTKFGKIALLTYCDLSDLDVLFTDDTDCEYANKLRQKGVRVL